VTVIVTPPPVSSPTWSARTKRIVSLILLAIIGIALWQVLDVLPLIVVATVLAFLLSPLTSLIQRILPGGRSVAILLTFVIVLVLLALLILIILPVLFNQFRDFATAFPDFVTRLQTDLEAALSQPITFRGEPVLINGEPLIPLDEIRAALGTQEGAEIAPPNIDLMGTVQGFVSSLAGPAFGVVGRTFTAVINIVFLLTLVFYLIRDSRKFTDGLMNVTPEAYRGDARRILYELREVWNDYLRGQLILCVAIGIFVLIAALLLGVPNAPMLALIAGITELVPNIGPLIALIPAALFALFSQSATLPFLSGVTFAIVVIVVWILIQNIEAVFIVPRVMGDTLNLHPVVVLIGVIVGANVAGILGVLLAAPVIASIRVFAQYFYGKLTDQDPFPPPTHKTPHPGLIERLRGQISRLSRRGQRAKIRG
jgi:predicted PurR-regulated permease PerM